MKKFIALVVVLAVTAVLGFACAEETGSFFAQFEKYDWSFSSGAGGWSTDMTILPDGSFTGQYHDSEMGEAADEYPDGTVYSCAFTGRLSLLEQADENTWKLRVDELKTEKWTEPEYIDGGIRFVFTEPYGISEGDEILLYRPGTPVNNFTEEMQMWAHLFDLENTADKLDSWFLWSEKNNSGFVGYSYE